MNFNRVFHFEPSILGENPLFLETPTYQREFVGFVLPRMPELTEEQAVNQFFSMSASNSVTGLKVCGCL